MHNIDTHTGPSFSLQNRLARAVWSVFYFLFIRFSPKPFHQWRIFWLRIFGAKVGKGVHIYAGVNIWAPWNIEIDDYSGIGNGVKLYSQGKITIGRKVVISQGAHICAGTHDYTHPGFPLVTKPIVIADYAWIAAEAFVHPGVIIADGCVIGARSVVAEDMPAWMICAGFPCKPIRERINADEIDNFKTANTSIL